MGSCFSKKSAKKPAEMQPLLPSGKASGKEVPVDENPKVLKKQVEKIVESLAAKTFLRRMKGLANEEEMKELAKEEALLELGINALVQAKLLRRSRRK